ncbi:MAG: type II secretion system protein [Candidatus Microsaccharimonas sp.]
MEYGMIRHTLQRGFTLIEMLVIAPIVILAIGAFLTVIISMTGEVLSSRASNVLTYNVQDALNRIEQDVKLSTTFLATNNITLVAGEAQGYNNDATAFTNVGGTSGTSLILNTLATTGNPLATTSGIVYQKDKPNACGDSRVADNTPMSINIVYFVKNNTLWRRTIMPSNYTSLSVYCVAPWQQPSCAPGYTAVFCKTEDIKLVEGVTAANFNVSYYNSAASTAVNTVASDTLVSIGERGTALQSLSTASVAINASQNVAGRTIERSAVVRVSRLDTNASAIADVVTPTTPSAPTLSGVLSSPTSVIYTWPKVNGADSYTFQYNINGGAWQTPVTNQNVNTYTVTAGTHTDVINGRVSATNTAGTSAYSATSTITIPKWANFNFQNGWVDYGDVWAPGGYTKTSAGVVVLKGLLRRPGNSTNPQTIATLPVGYRPSQNYIYQRVGNSAVTRVDVRADGVVQISGINSDVSLDGIAFQPSGTTFTSLSLLNGWVVYGDSFYGQAPGYAIDGSGRVELRAMISGGTATDGTDLWTLPASTTPNQYMHMPAFANGNTVFSVSASPSVADAKGGSNAWYSIHSLYWPSSRATGSTCTTQWCNMTLQNSWVHYGAPFSTPQYTKGSDGVVSLKGLLGRGSAATQDTNILTLPAGYRPAGRLLISVANAYNGVARIDILANGDVRYILGSNVWLSLDGINFVAEQ